MEELRELYGQKRYMELQKKCQEQMESPEAGAEVYGYCACAQAARNNLSRPSLKEGTANFRKAFARGKEEQKLPYLEELYASFAGEVKKALAASEQMIASLSLDAEIMLSYRECLSLGIEALLAAAEEAEAAGLGADTEEPRKEALRYMREYCLTRHYDVDMGKNVMHKSDNIPDEVRAEYVARYDQLVQKIREKDPAFEPEEDIQRERKLPSQERQEERAREEAEGKKRSLLDKFMDLF